jgi:hypothetical protein
MADEPEKKKRLKYDINLLTKFCAENNVELLKDYSGEKLTYITLIEGKCVNCENSFNKIFAALYKCNGYYCSSCYNKIIIEKMKKTCLEKHGVEFVSQSKEVKEKVKATCMKNYGVESNFQSQEIKEKIKETNMVRYGVEYSSQLKEIRDKTKATCFKKYGSNPLHSKEAREKTKATNMIKYGAEYPFQSQEIQEKSKVTNIERYGFENPSHNAVISEKASKNAYKAKDYVFPSGRIERIQGYEKFMLDELLQKENVTENDIIVSRKDVPTIWYEDSNGKKHRYFIDCYIPSQNRCIEAKSMWTAEKKKDCIFLKQQAVKDAGYKCEIWIYNSKGEKVESYM